MIPSIFHFIFFNVTKDISQYYFTITDYLAIKSAAVVNKPSTIFFHYDYEPKGEWWEKTKPLLTLNKMQAPESVMDQPLYHVAHKADVVRLQMLKEYGGTYLDLDTICVKPLEPLYNNKFVIGQELKAPYEAKNWRQQFKAGIKNIFSPEKKENGIAGLCSGVILSEKNSAFVNLWLNSYKTFRSKGKDKYWNEHSGIISAELAKTNPELVTVLNPYAFHYPLYNKAGLRMLFEKAHTFPEAYVHHFWSSFSKEKYLSKLTFENIFENNTTYNLAARRFLST